MSFWTAIVVIVAIAAFANRRRTRYLAHTYDGRADEPRPQPQRDPELEREVAALRERVKVLERIVTDERRSRGLADEIEALRD
ncbi:MAG: hypothetical protein JF593_14275 [Novosphingobium sp.]|nr:hypothetical protein [Novosphingobium sp.]